MRMRASSRGKATWRPLAVALVLATCTNAVWASECDPISREIASYEGAMNGALTEEPEDLPKDLMRFARLFKSGKLVQARRIADGIRSSQKNMAALTAPKELLRIHTDLVDYYENGVAGLDALDAGNEKAYRKAEIKTWVGLRQYFVNLRDLFLKYTCYPEEVEAIEQKYLPSLDESLAKLRKG